MASGQRSLMVIEGSSWVDLKMALHWMDLQEDIALGGLTRGHCTEVELQEDIALGGLTRGHCTEVELQEDIALGGPTRNHPTGMDIREHCIRVNL